MRHNEWADGDWEDGEEEQEDYDAEDGGEWDEYEGDCDWAEVSPALNQLNQP